MLKYLNTLQPKKEKKTKKYQLSIKSAKRRLRNVIKYTATTMPENNNFWQGTKCDQLAVTQY